MYNYETKCPLFETHDKYMEAWYFLCSMVKNYHDAHLFRWNLNAFIQSLRNVTFMLQSEKSKIPRFESWYSEKQELMKKSQLLVNIREGRNIIVKQRMLKSKSKASMGVFRGYQIKLGMEGFELDPFTDSEQLLKYAQSHLIPLMLDKEHSAIGEQIGIKRTWIVEEIGDEEVVGLCYKAWKSIGDIVAKAHKLLHFGFLAPDFEIEKIEPNFIILESDVDPSLPEKWGWC